MKCPGKRPVRAKSYELAPSNYTLCPLRSRCTNYSVSKPTIEAAFKKKSCKNFVNRHKEMDAE